METMARDAGTAKITRPEFTPSQIRWIATLGVLLASAAGATGVAQAGFPGTWERWERLQGAGWGDGYHAGRPSGVRPFADLPPKYPLPAHRSAVQNVRGISPRDGNYYDRFDAYCAAVENGPVRVDDSGAGVAPGHSDRHTGPTLAVVPSLNTPIPKQTTAGPDTTVRMVSARPDLSRARLPRVAVADDPNLDARADPGPIGNGHSRSPRVAQVPDYLVIRQPR